MSYFALPKHFRSTKFIAPYQPKHPRSTRLDIPIASALCSLAQVESPRAPILSLPFSHPRTTHSKRPIFEIWACNTDHPYSAGAIAFDGHKNTTAAVATHVSL